MENEVSVYDKFLEDINFKDDRYEVRLPLKEKHPAVHNNYALSLKRLNKLKVRLREKPQVLKQYDDVIKDQLEQGIIEIVDDKKLI